MPAVLRQRPGALQRVHQAVTRVYADMVADLFHYGHVAFLGLYDPSTTPTGTLGGPEIKRLLAKAPA